ncbi:MAG: AzlD domain-containing protein, partial [Pseudomonadota bacterium]
MMPDAVVWAVILVLGVGTYLIRFSFLGILGARPLPFWALRLLRYVPVAVMPAIAAPMVVWPEATGGLVEPSRLLAAAAVIAVGVVTRSVL